jgi:archaellum biogenesis ATPase FlaH
MIIQKVNDLIPKAFAELKSFQQGEKKIVKTGFDCLDSHIGGLLNGDITLICGLSGHGKSEFLFKMKENLLDTELNPDAKDYVFLDISLEMKMFNKVLRGINRSVDKSKKKILFEEFSSEEKILVNQYYKSLMDDRQFVVQTSITPQEFYTSCQQFLTEHQDKKAVFISIDHILLLTGSDKKATLDAATEYMNKLKLEFENVYFIILSQLNRSVLGRVAEKNNLSAPNSSDLFGSDFMQQASSYAIVIFNAFKVSIDQYLKVDPGYYDYLSEHFGDIDSKSGKVSFNTLGKLFYHVVKLREGDSVSKDVFIEDMRMSAEDREKLSKTRESHKAPVATPTPVFNSTPSFDAVSFNTMALSTARGSGFEDEEESPF